MLLEVQKREPDKVKTEITDNEPLVSVVMDRWPALFSETGNQCQLRHPQNDREHHGYAVFAYAHDPFHISAFLCVYFR